ncbi:MAG: hypothetical protein WCF79_05300 [Rhodomicrobium sp.]
MPGNGTNFKLRQQRVQEWLGIVQKQRFRALGQFEPDIIRERTRAGLDAVMARRARSNGLGTYRRLELTPSHPFNLS